MENFEGTFWQELVKNAILSFSGLGIGATIYMVVYDVKQAIRSRGHTRKLWLARAMFAGGFIMVIGLLATLIFQTGEPIPIEFNTIFFTIAVCLSAIGGLGVAFETRRADKEEKEKGNHP